MSVTAEIAPNTLTWEEASACAKLPFEETHGPKDEGIHDRNIREKRIIAEYCFQCPVLRECFTDTLNTQDEFGVRGGTGEADRKKYFDGQMTLQELKVSGLQKVLGKEAVTQLIANIPVQRAPETAQSTEIAA